jgi:hypothetical protein
MIMLAGEPGIGKTRTGQKLASLAESRGAKVIWGWNYEGEGAPILVMAPVDTIAHHLWDANRDLQESTNSDLHTSLEGLQDSAAVHFGLEDIRVSKEIGNFCPHPALKLWSGDVRTPTLGNADPAPPAGAFVTVDAPAEVTYQTPAVFGSEQYSLKPIGALGVAGGVGFVLGQPPSHNLPLVAGDDWEHNREILQPMPSVEWEWLGQRSVGVYLAPLDRSFCCLAE